MVDTLLNIHCTQILRKERTKESVFLLCYRWIHNDNDIDRCVTKTIWEYLSTLFLTSWLLTSNKRENDVSIRILHM